MKKFFAIASLFALTLSACAEKEQEGEQQGKGRVDISLVTSAEVADTRANISCTTPEWADFALTIEGGRDYKAEYASIAEFEDNYLYFGSYKASVKAGDVHKEGFGIVAFEGSETFAVEPRANTNVTITATIANAVVKVETTENFERYFAAGHTFTLTTAAGNEFDVTAQEELLFIAPAEFSVVGTAVKQAAQSGKEGVTVTLREFKQSDVKAQTLYTVKFDVETAGSATLNITLNETLVESIDIEQELNDNAQ